MLLMLGTTHTNYPSTSVSFISFLLERYRDTNEKLEMPSASCIIFGKYRDVLTSLILFVNNNIIPHSAI